jgi:hypothetical protein
MERGLKNLVKSVNATNNEIFEKDIYVDKFGVLRYSLSNDYTKIEEAVYNRIGNANLSILEEAAWILNPSLSKNVKTFMNKYNVNYSMTCYTFMGLQLLAVNKRNGNQWYIKIVNYSYR